MLAIGRSNPAVFMSPFSTGERHAFSEGRLQGAVKARANAVVRVQYQPRDRSAGDRLRVGGLVSLRGPQATLSFRQGDAGAIDESVPPVAQDLELLPPGTSIPIPERVIPLDESASPLLWLSFGDFDQASLSDTTHVGRAPRRPLHVDALFELPALTTTWITVRGISRSGPELLLRGELQLSAGLVLRLELAASGDRNGDPGDQAATHYIPVAARGCAVGFAEHSVAPEVRGQPLVSMALKDWGGHEAGAETPVGWLARIH
jgi:hypothetical protein